MASDIKAEPLSNAEDYVESFSAYDENGDVVDLTGAVIKLVIEDPNSQSTILSGSTTDGKITISTTVATITIPQGEIADVNCKNFNVGCAIDLNGRKTQLGVGTISIYDGFVTWA